MSIKKIIFCTDFSENSGPARDYAMQFAKAFDAQLIVFHVVNSRPLGYPLFEERIPVDLAELQRTIEQSAREELDTIVSEYGKELADVTAFFRTGEPAVEVVRFADEENADLIVLGTHGWTGFKHLLLGSTAENVVRSAKCAVLTVRGPSNE